MIRGYLILISAAATAAGVGFAAIRSGWERGDAVSAAVLAALFIVLWRAAANLTSLNEDFGPLVSVGDAGCLVAGALGPIFVAAIRPPVNSPWFPAIAGGLLGFVVNVVIL